VAKKEKKDIEDQLTVVDKESATFEAEEEDKCK
jgi:hypothetical protein